MLEKYRIKQGYTHKEMAKLLDIPTATYYAYEKGTRIMPYRILQKFLIMRNEKHDKKLVGVINEYLEKGHFKAE